MNKLLRDILLVVVNASIIAFGFNLAYAYAEEPAKQYKLEAGSVQDLSLQVRQRDAMVAKTELDLAQERVARAQAKLANSLGALAAECHKVRDDLKWPATVECDFNTLAFTDSKPADKPKTEAAPEAPKPPPVVEKKKKK